MLLSFINLVHLVDFSALAPSARSVIASSSRASFHGLIWPSWAASDAAASSYKSLQHHHVVIQDPALHVASAAVFSPHRLRGCSRGVPTCRRWNHRRGRLPYDSTENIYTPLIQPRSRARGSSSDRPCPSSTDTAGSACGRRRSHPNNSGRDADGPRDLRSIV